MTAKPISRAPSKEASSGGSPSSMRRWMFSISTMASSTTMPMASTMASSVSTLIEAPKNATTMKEAMTETGIATMATMVERQSRRKTRMTRMTRPMPSSSVFSTPLIEARMNCALVVHDVASRCRAAARRLSFSSSARTPSATVERVRGRLAHDAEADARCCRPCRTRSGRPRAPTSTSRDLAEAHEVAVLVRDDDLREFLRASRAANRS